MTILHMHEHYQGPEPLNYWPGPTIYEHQCYKCGSRTQEVLPSDYSDPRFISSLIRELRGVLWYTHQTYNSLRALKELFATRCGGEPKEAYREITEKTELLKLLSDKANTEVWGLVRDLQNKIAEKDRQLSEATAALSRLSTKPVYFDLG